MLSNDPFQGLDPNDNQFASKAFARIDRATWEDYKRRFLGNERDLANYVTSDRALHDELGSFGQAASQQYRAGLDSLGRKFERYGVTPGADQQAVNKRLAGLEYARTRDYGATAIGRADLKRKLSLAAGAPAASLGGA